MSPAQAKRFCEDYLNAMRDNAAALFIGAGLSKDCGFVDWRGLLRDIADELGLNVDVEHDLIALAQYHVNHRGGRGHLNQIIVNEFTRNTTLGENHDLIAQLPVDTVWTTNYDDLLERGYQGRNRRYDKKVTTANLSITVPWRDVVLYKMHGDISDPDDAVLTKEDYESYDSKRQAFSSALQGDLVKKTFLFMGFSFEDPNIDYILSRIRVLLGQNARQHYCVMKTVSIPSTANPKERAELEYSQRKQQLRIADLKRYGIQALMIDDYAEVTGILRELAHRVHLPNVLISGSAQDYAPLGQDRVESLAMNIAKTCLERDMNVVSGYGLGIGSSVILGAMNAAINNNIPFSQRLRLWPFPQNIGPTTQAIWTRWREQMIDSAGFVVFLAGNKLQSGNVVRANGVYQEFEIAKAKKRYPIPVGATGHVAQEIWTEVSAHLPAFYSNLPVAAAFTILNDPVATNDQLLAAIFEIMRIVRTT